MPAHRPFSLLVLRVLTSVAISLAGAGCGGPDFMSAPGDTDAGDERDNTPIVLPDPTTPGNSDASAEGASGGGDAAGEGSPWDANIDAMIVREAGDASADGPPADALPSPRDALSGDAPSGDMAPADASSNDAISNDAWSNASDASACSATQLACGGVCVPNDVHHCGACSSDCTTLTNVTGSTTCAMGHCSVPGSSCAAGWGDCNGDPMDGCETDITKPAHCGGCGNACSGGTPACSMGAANYACVSGCPSATPTLCNGTCVDTNSNRSNCGGCGTASACADGKACLSGVCSGQLAATGIAFSATQSLAFAGSVATLTDRVTADVPGTLTASIDWGDGSTSTGTIAGASGAFTVTGTHTYATSGAKSATVTVNDPSTGASANATTPVTVAPQLTVTGGPITATQGLALTGIIANVADAITTEPSGTLVATIDWGDGSAPSFGALSGVSGVYAIGSGHTYATIGTVTVTVTMTNAGTGARASANITASVRPPPTVTEYPLQIPKCYPTSIAVGSDGNLWVAEGGCGQIGRITPIGILTELSPPSSFSCPNQIVSGPDGNLWFFENCANKIGRTSTDFSFAEFPVPSPNDSGTNAITSAGDHNVWFTEPNPNVIGRITTAGTITEFPIPTANAHLAGITSGPDNNVWFVEAAGKVGRISTVGAVTEFALAATIGSSGAITTGVDGNLWIALSPSGIARMTPMGVSTDLPGPPVLRIAPGPDGNMWFTEAAGNNIGRMTTTGAYTEFAIPTASADAFGIVTGPDANVWFVEDSGNKIGRITP